MNSPRDGAAAPKPHAPEPDWRIAGNSPEGVSSLSPSGAFHSSGGATSLRWDTDSGAGAPVEAPQRRDGLCIACNPMPGEGARTPGDHFELTARRLTLLRHVGRWGASRCEKARADRAELKRVTLAVLAAEVRG